MEMNQFLGRKHTVEVFERDVSSLRAHLGKGLILGQPSWFETSWDLE